MVAEVDLLMDCPEQSQMFRHYLKILYQFFQHNKNNSELNFLQEQEYILNIVHHLQNFLNQIQMVILKILSMEQLLDEYQ